MKKMTEFFFYPNNGSSFFPQSKAFYLFVFFTLFIDSGSESGSHKSIRDKRQSGPSDGKPTRVRTVLNEKQLHTLR